MRVKCKKKKRCKHVPVHALKAYCGSRGIATSLLNLDTRWRRVVNFMPPAALPPGKEPRYPLNRRLGGLHSWSELLGEEKNFLPLARF
jgi:hypothetical protein